MKNKIFWEGIITAFFLVISLPAHAILIGFEPLDQTVQVGDPAEVALVISELGDYSAPSIGIFDLNITYDPLILAFDSVFFGDPILGDQLDLLGLGSYYEFDDSTPSTLNLLGLSVDPPLILDLFQAGSFTMATLTFDTLAVGTSSLDIAINSLGDASGDSLTAGVLSGSISPVPEPATIILLASGIAGIGVFGRKKIRNKS